MTALNSWRVPAIAACALLFPSPMAAQADRDSLQATVERAMAQIERGEFGAARERVAESLRRCPRGAHGTRCRQVLQYTLGYVAQLHANEPDANRFALLTSSVAYYKASLREELDRRSDDVHEPTLQNLRLVFAALGPDQITRREVADVLWIDPAHAAQYHTLLGDHYFSEGKLDSARAEYRTALASTRTDPVPLARLTSLAEGGDAHAVELLAALTPGVEDRFAAAAGAAYRAVLQATYATDSARASDALTRWVNVRAMQRSLGEDALAELPEGWSDPALRSLRAFIDSPEMVLGPDDPWRATRDRRYALAHAGLALGFRRIETGAHQAAEQYWTSSRSWVEPGSRVWIDLSRELASLYASRPALDLDHAKFMRLEAELFAATAGEPSREQLAARQRLHTALGFIYAERGAWSDTAEPRRGALFQLEQALSMARAREATERVYQPLPGIRAARAAGLMRIDTASASAAYLEAARAHLDVDDAEGARAMLAHATRGGAAPAAEEVRSVLERRFGAGSPRCDLVPRPDTAGRPHLPQESVDAATRGFVGRQEFRLLADCAASAADTVASRYAADALALALWGEPRGMRFADASDLGRFDLVKDLVRERFGLRARPVQVLEEPPRDSLAVPTFVLNETPRYLVLDRGTLLAARLAAMLPVSIGRSRVRIERSGLVIRGAETDPLAAELAARLRAVEGVREIRFDP
jgi:hypothetical protein